jgi:predicted GH43/DUF377 family glycosyl hydrolase
VRIFVHVHRQVYVRFANNPQAKSIAHAATHLRTLPVFQTMDGSVYRLGVALHDLQNPAKIVGVGDSWILQPEDPWEVTGYVHNVVFTCGAVPESEGTVKIYWGGADTVMCAGEANVWDLVTLCLEHGRPAK